MTSARLCALLAVLLLPACKEDDPPGNPDGPTAIDATSADAPTDGPPADGNAACLARDTDYQPRVNSSADDMYPACVSDQDQYVMVGTSVSTISRVQAFEQIATLLFTSAAPSRDAFIQARTLYLASEGLGSRVDRREDEHYPPVPGNVQCRNLVPAMQALYPERCVGPVKLKPLVEGNPTAGMIDNRGFTLGTDLASTELQRRLAAAQIEAGLVWFLHVSMYKEATTCGPNSQATQPADCDSSWAYYSGGEQRNAGIGFARYVRGLETLTHDRIFDGVLAVRCWRNLDDPAVTTDDAMFAPLRTMALAQLDRGIARGIALIVRARLVALQTATGDDATVHWELVRNLGPSVLREAAARDQAMAQMLATELAKTDASQVDEASVISVLDALFPCP